MEFDICGEKYNDRQKAEILGAYLSLVIGFLKGI